MTAQDVVAAVHAYLLGRGWYRDGDDPGVWIPPGSSDGSGGVGVGDALSAQLVADGVGWPDA